MKRRILIIFGICFILGLMINVSAGAVTTTLNLPADSSTYNSNLVTFNFTSSTTGTTIKNMTLWTNETSWSAKVTSTLLNTYTNGTEYTETTCPGGNVVLKATVDFGDDRIYNDNITAKLKKIGGSNAYGAMRFYYLDGTSYKTADQSESSTSYVTHTFDNPYVTKLVNKVDILLCSTISGTAYLDDTTFNNINTQNVNNTILDAFSSGDSILWNVRTCDSAGNCTFAASNYSFDIDSINPNITVIYPSGTYDYFANGQSVALNYSATDNGVVDTCWYNYNGTNQTIGSCANTTITLSNGDTNLILYVNDTAGNTISQSVDYDSYIFENSQTYSSTTTEGATETFIINISYNDVSYLNSQAYLIYNGTSYLASRSGSSGTYIFSKTIDIPIAQETVNYTFYWSIGINNGTYNYYNSSENSQVINDINIDDCSSYNIVILNYSIYDEDTRAFLNNNTWNTTSNVNVRFSPSFSGEDYIELNFSTTDNPISICLENNLSAGQNYRLDAEIQFSSGGHVTEFYYIENHSLSTTNIPVQIKLYDLLITNSQEFLITFKDSYFIPLKGAIIEITRKYLSLGGFITIENIKTDSDGRGIGHLVLNDEVYTINVYKNGELRATYENVMAFCSNIATGDCRINLNELGSSTSPSSFINYLNINGIGYYNDTTKTYTFTFSSSDGTAKSISVNITKYDNYLNTTICTDSINSASGTLSCVIPSTYYNTTILVQNYVNGELFSSSIFDVSSGNENRPTATRFILAFFLILILPLIAVGSATMSLIFFVIGLIAASALFLIDFGGFVGIGSAFIWIIVAIGILIWKMNRRAE